MSVVRKILVVDDDPVVSKSINRVLASKGYAVISAHDGEEALNKLNTEKYDLVFTDIKMPGISGLEVAERVKASQPWLPVVIVTGYGTDAYEARAAAAGVSGFLRKPLSPEMIDGSTDKALHELDATAAAVTVEVAAPIEIEKSESRTKNVVLFLAAPFIGLLYVMAMPFVAAGMLIWIGGKALAKKVPIVKPLTMTIVAPILGFAMIVAAPFVGIGLLGWYGTRALLKQ
ncbi:MAG: response regulator [Betaproteobacteria bacterium]|nr:response regulator [Betaproteobacteria bacterium]